LLLGAFVLVAVLGFGALDYMDLGESKEEAEAAITEKAEAVPAKKATEKKEPMVQEKPIVEMKEAVVEEKPNIEEVAKEAVAPKVEERPPVVGNRVAQISAPKGTGRTVAPPVVVQHPAGGSRVLMHPPAPKQEPSAAEAAKELQAARETAMSVEEAHHALRANLDESLFADLDSLSPSELKVRVVQLAAEMKERTKWEAVRLKEFLAMKEKETADK
jgi:hypothetical protein